MKIDYDKKQIIINGTVSLKLILERLPSDDTLEDWEIVNEFDLSIKKFDQINIPNQTRPLTPKPFEYPNPWWEWFPNTAPQYVEPPITCTSGFLQVEGEPVYCTGVITTTQDDLPRDS